MKLTPSLHRVGSDLVNSYLVEESGKLTLIDAGVSGQWSDLTAEVAAMGRSVADIRGVVFTHGDSDHVGFAERLRRDHGVPVPCTRRTRPLLGARIKRASAWGR